MKAIAVVLFAGMVTACGAAASSSGRSVQSETAANAPFTQYHTFAFRLAGAPPPPFHVSARSFEVENRMRPLIVAELQGKGYVETTGDAKPDFLVRFASGYNQEAGPSQGEPGGSVPAPKDIDKGQLVIDVFDASTEAQVWHGTAEAIVNPDKIDDQRLQAGVKQVLVSFPARSADGSQLGAASQQPR
jgi:hypothetical protein